MKIHLDSHVPHDIHDCPEVITTYCSFMSMTFKESFLKELYIRIKNGQTTVCTFT